MAVSTREQFDQTAASVGAALRAAARRFSGRRMRAVMLNAPGLVEIALAIATGVVFLSAAYALFAPLPAPKTLPSALAPTDAAPEPVSISITPFRTAALEPEAPAIVAEETSDAYEETKLDLKLHGVFTIGDVPSAYIQTPDGKQQIFYLGDEIWNGVSLAQVMSDYVVISASGVRETLTLVNRDPSKHAETGRRAPSPQREDSEGAPDQPAAAFRIGDAAQLSVQLTSGEASLIVTPGANRASFDATGLKLGDKIIAVNNQRLGANLATEARNLAALTKAKSVSLLIERDGETIPIELKLPRNSVSNDNGEDQ